MKNPLPSMDPIEVRSLKSIFVSRFEELILSGQLSIGQKLPSERELALQLGVSRPVVHEGLVELSFMGLISLKSRVGAVVSDYRREGSLAILNSLLRYHEGAVDPTLLKSALEMRKLFELETAKLAALNREEEHLDAFENILKMEREVAFGETREISRIDFDFHHQVALATGNMIYPLMLNSFKQFYTNLTTIFFSDSELVEFVFGVHSEMIAAIRDKSPFVASDLMKKLLEHGEAHVLAMIEQEQ